MPHKVLKVDNAEDCIIFSRLNRFVVNIEVDGVLYRGYINNTGRLAELLIEGRKGYCVKNPVDYKTRYRLFGVKLGGLAAIIDTRLQMKVFEKAIEMNLIPWIRNYRVLKRNVRLGNSLIDYLLSHNGNEILVEVKSAALKDGDYAMYPDCQSLRGRKHIMELMDYSKKGGKALILFIAAVPYVSAFRPNVVGDEVIARLLKDAYDAGVILKSISIFYNPIDNHIYLDNPDLYVTLE
jgi:sugar fermentation stimulation protein A